MAIASDEVLLLEARVGRWSRVAPPTKAALRREARGARLAPDDLLMLNRELDELGLPGHTHHWYGFRRPDDPDAIASAAVEGAREVVELVVLTADAAVLTRATYLYVTARLRQLRGAPESSAASQERSEALARAELWKAFGVENLGEPTERSRGLDRSWTFGFEDKSNRYQAEVPADVDDLAKGRSIAVSSAAE